MTSLLFPSRKIKLQINKETTKVIGQTCKFIACSVKITSENFNISVQRMHVNANFKLSLRHNASQCFGYLMSTRTIVRASDA